MPGNKEDILDSLDSSEQDRYESEMAHVFADLEQDKNLGQAIEKVFQQTDDIDEIQSKITLLVKERLQLAKETNEKPGEELHIDPKSIGEDIKEFCQRVMPDIDESLDPKSLDSKDNAKLLNTQAKKDLKKLLKSFAVYEAYKLMNPKRIAGETAKTNYQHNLIRGGQKLAGKYEGGREADLKKYGESEVKRMQKNAVSIKKKGGFSR